MRCSLPNLATPGDFTPKTGRLTVLTFLADSNCLVKAAFLERCLVREVAGEALSFLTSCNFRLFVERMRPVGCMRLGVVRGLFTVTGTLAADSPLVLLVRTQVLQRFPG